MRRRSATTRAAVPAGLPQPPRAKGEHSEPPPPAIAADWICYRPRQHPVWLAIVVLLLAAWIGFLLWMAAQAS